MVRIFFIWQNISQSRQTRRIAYALYVQPRYERNIWHLKVFDDKAFTLDAGTSQLYFFAVCWISRRLQNTCNSNERFSFSMKISAIFLLRRIMLPLISKEAELCTYTRKTRDKEDDAVDWLEWDSCEQFFHAICLNVYFAESLSCFFACASRGFM